MELQRANGWAPFTHVADRCIICSAATIEHEMMPMCAHYGLGLTAWSPLAGGFLSRQISPARTSAIPTIACRGFDMIPFDKDAGFCAGRAMRDIADGHGASVAQVALAWLLAKPHGRRASSSARRGSRSSTTIWPRPTSR